MCKSFVFRILGGCAVMALWMSCSDMSPGPVSVAMLQKLDANTLSKAELQRMTASGELKFSANPPALEEVRIPMKTDGHSVAVQCGVEGKNAVMFLDTGASRTMLDAGTAVRHNVKLLHPEDFKVRMRGIVGEEEARIGIISPLNIGGWQLDAYPCLIRTQQGGSGIGYGPSLLGVDLPHKFCSYMTIDYQGRQVIFGFRRSFREPAGPRMGSIPFRFVNGTPTVRLSSAGVSWDATVDTGSFNGIELSKEVADQMGIANAGRAVRDMLVMGVGGMVHSEDAGMRTLTLTKLFIGGMDFAHAEVDISPGAPRVGCFFLKDYRVTFDFQRNLLWLEW